MKTKARRRTPTDRILILTPVKNAARHLKRYFQALEALTYPRRLLSLGLLEGDSDDGTYERLRGMLRRRRAGFRAVHLFRKDFGFVIPRGMTRSDPSIQVERRGILAKARNHLLFRALDDEDWVLWIDVDVVEYPADVIQRLLAARRDIVTPNCVWRFGGPSFDRNAWRDRGRRHLHDLKSEGKLVPLDAVGGTMLLVRADVHRDGVIFPPFPYGLPHRSLRRNNHWLGEIETEGLGLMAADAGVQCWGMPHLEIRHYPG